MSPPPDTPATEASEFGALDPDGVAQLREAFLADFEDFAGKLPDDEFFNSNERYYKLELAELLREAMGPERFVAEMDAGAAQAVAADLRAVLTKPLRGSDNRPQNLLNWRYSEFLSKMDDAEAVEFARAVGDLLHGEGPSPERLERFNAVFAPLAARHGTSGPAITRSFPTLLLMLNDPEHDIYVRSDTFSTLGRMMFGRPLYRNAPFDAEQYRDILTVSRAVFNTLEEWGWRPRDMIDLQSVIWRATSYKPPDDGAVAIAVDVDIDATATGTESVDGQSPGGSYERLLHALADQRLYFPPELVSNYLLALQAKRLVILTGISGTGKTKLAQAVAQHFRPVHSRKQVIGLEEGTEATTDRLNYAVIAVHPDWTDRRGLLGFHNPLTGAYVTTPFLRLLLRARADVAVAADARKPHPYFVVLDEMNLARVEHYFADFLSALESGEPLHLHDDPRIEHGLSGAGDEDGIAVPRELTIPRNLFITGTVNVDETTYMFSPKVLDRAFTIELNTVDLAALGIGVSGRRGADATPLRLERLPEMPVQGERPSAEDWRRLRELPEEDLAAVVMAFHDEMARVNRHFGYRVANEIGRFVTLAAEQAGDDPDTLWAAMDLSVLQKILPKFHGTQQELQDVLQALFRLAMTGGLRDASSEATDWRRWTPSRDGIHAVADERSPADERLPTEADDQAITSPLLPRSAAKLWRMLDRLERQGFTSFIE